MDGAYIKVVRGDDEVVVAETSSRDFVVDSIRALKMMGVHMDTQIIIYGVCGKPQLRVTPPTLNTPSGALGHHARSPFSIQKDHAMSACPQCNLAIEPSPHKRPRTYCGPPCQITAANARRQTTRAGRTSGAARPIHGAGEPPTRPLSPTLPTISPTVDRSSSDPPATTSYRLSELMEKAHSRGGVTAWEIAEIARARNISPWAPLSVIIAPSKDL
jgi:hypothetical protein